jgi:hypothetical protein
MAAAEAVLVPYAQNPALSFTPHFGELGSSVLAAAAYQHDTLAGGSSRQFQPKSGLGSPSCQAHNGTALVQLG